MTPRSSPTRLRVRSLLAAGHPDKEIARLTGRSCSTVKTHLRRLFKELGVANRTQAALRIAKQGERHG